MAFSPTISIGSSPFSEADPFPQFNGRSASRSGQRSWLIAGSRSQCRGFFRGK